MLKTDHQLVLFSGTSHALFAKEMADCLQVPLGKIQIGRFPDGEIDVQILESVRNKEVFVLQTIAHRPNEFLIELLIIIDALKRASAKSITAVIPYFGYCRQDRKDKARVPITAKLVANLLETAGINRLVTMDLHAGQLQGFFDVPVENLRSLYLMKQAIQELSLDPLIVVAPDSGSAKLARDYAQLLGVDYAVVDKVRYNAATVSTMQVIGDVKGKNVLLADDICSTGSTLVSAAKACREKGALKVVAVITHGIFTGEALQMIDQSTIDVLFVSNTVPQADRLRNLSKFHIVSVASHFAEAVDCILTAGSIHSLYTPST